jgi:hypothetical protein
MGSGTYYAVGFGCVELPPLGDDDGPLYEIFDAHGIQTSYEGATRYAVVPLLNTLARKHEHQIPSGVMPIEDLAAAIESKIGAKDIEKTAETWRTVQAAAAALDPPIKLPDGRLIWLCDYD